MSDDPKSLLRGFYAEMSAGNIDAVDRYIADDFVEHEEFPGISPDKKGVKQFFAMMHAAFPDMRMEADEIVQEGDMLCARATFSGTHQAEFLGIPASAKRVEVALFDMLRIRDGQAVEHWGLMDAMTMMQQLGAVPAPAPAA
jgi:steroid delta-isomerase-like uncharacterized protein